MAPSAKWWDRNRGPGPGARHVFISHASYDRAPADQVVRTLETAGVPCWIAPRDIPAGRTWASAVVDGIHECPVLIVLLTERSSASPEVHREVQLASHDGKQMLPVRLDPRAHLAGPLAYFLSSIQWIDATARPLGPQLDPLPAAVGRLLGMPVADVRRRGPARRDRDTDDGRGTVSLDELLRRGPRS
jgi:hypothetical protein